MLWIIIALCGHAANGFAFIIDKILLKNTFKRSATYAGLVGLLSGLTVILIPWIDAWPKGLALMLGIVSGITFMAALWTFFTALSSGEATRVVPIISASIPMITLAETSIFLNERLTLLELIGFFSLIVATILLASGKTQNRLSKKAIFFSLFSALLFAVSSVTGKYTYDTAGFLSGFVTTRIVATTTAVLLALLIDPMSGAEIMQILHPKKDKKDKKQISGTNAAKLAIVGQILGGLGFIAIQYAISLGSASIVNALQVMQFALMVVVAFFLKSKAQTLLGESLNKSVILIKSVALIVMAAGLYLIVT